MNFIDTHTHISDEAFHSEEEAVIERALQAGVFKMLMADVDSGERDAMRELCTKHKGVLYPMLGLYPGSVKENWHEELDKVFALSEKGGVVAIGEVGLDYHFSTEFAKEQMEVFVAQLELASKKNLPVNVHLRDATEDFFKAMEACKGLGLRGNLHAFSGSAQTLLRLRKYGDWSVGIGGVLTFKNAGIAKELEDIDLEQIVLETDAPYLSPTPKRGQRNESANIPLIAQKIADIKGIGIEEVAQRTTANAQRLFSLL
ncbi:MAG: TatD family hydrolase [Candidatus Cryptobacteroides sp.]